MWKRLLTHQGRRRRQQRHHHYRHINAAAASSFPRGKDRVVKDYKVGQEVAGGFVVTQTLPISEYSLQMIQLVHPATGAEMVHFDTEDSNNVFAINFKTPPVDSSGIAHVLEHTVLCGSKKFPVRDPFFNMLKRSLNTYMNALTASDHTMYPFSTCNVQDWMNLRDVYADATFFPNLSEQDFRQEGIRLDTSDDDDKNHLIYKGVVYNEMKGVFADSNNLFASTLSSELLKESQTYSAVSGGTPKEIPTLTIDALREFHERHYRPSNALFYSYGDLPFENHCEFLSSKVLSQFKKTEDVVSISSLPSKWKSPRSVEIECAKTDDDKVTWSQSMVVGNSSDAYESLVFKMLSYLLLSGPSSPMYQALIDSNLASDFGAGTGFDSSTIDTTFGISVQGVDEKNLEKVSEAVKSALESVALRGFETDRVEGLLHQIELGQKHIVGNFGLNLMHSVATVWTHGSSDFKNAASINEALTKLKHELAINPSFWQEKVSTSLLNNPHTLVMVMRPSDTFVEREAQEEAKALEALRPNTDVKKLRELNTELELMQSAEQDIECLPTLDVRRDIPRKVQQVTETFARPVISTPTFWIPSTTNEVCYVRAAFDLPSSSGRNMNLFTSTFGQLGAASRDHRELSTYMERIGGGISASSIVAPDLQDTSVVTEKLVVESLCLNSNIAPTVDTMADIITSSHFDNVDQIGSIIDMGYNSAMQSISSSGHSLAKRAAAASLTPASQRAEDSNGLTQIARIKKLYNRIKPDDGGLYNTAALQEISIELKNLSETCFSQENLGLSIVSEEKDQEAIEANLKRLIAKLQGNNSLESSVSSVSSPSSSRYFTAPVSVHFVAQCFPTVPFLHPDNAPLTVLSQLLSSCFLHKEVREKGGAYGVMTGQAEGVFSLVSYFDPNTLNTLNAYETSLGKLANGEFSDRDIDQAKLSVFSGVDAPVSPSAKGRMEFLRGLTLEMRQLNRERLLSVTREEVLDVAQKYFVSANAQSARQQVIVGTDASASAFSDLGWSVSPAIE